MKRFQGLPLNTIVLAAIAIFVLLLIIGFSSGTLSKIFKGFGQQTSTVTIDAARAECSRLCANLKTQYDGKIYTDGLENKVKEHEYAKKQFLIEGQDNPLHCWESPINVYCSITLYKTDGSIKYVCKPPTGTSGSVAFDCNAP